MKIINKILYLTISEAVECGIASDNYLRKAKSEGTKCWDLIDDPDDKRRVLVGFEALNDMRKRLVEVRFGNPYDLVARKPILDMVVNDWKAHEYFMGYRYQLGSLPPERVNQYTRAASWLKMLGAVDKGKVKKDLGLLLTEFYMHVSELLSLEKERGKLKGYAGVDVLPGDFPSSYQRLIAKVSAFGELRMTNMETAWDSLIDPLYGNKNASKIGKLAEGVNTLPVVASEGDNDTKDLVLVPKSAEKRGGYCPDVAEKQMAVIRHCASLHNNLDAGQVKKFVDFIFVQNGWKTLSRARIHDIMSENKHLTTSGSKGKDVFRNEMAMQMKRKTTDAPLKYWTLDGWMVELIYQERGLNKKNHSQVNFKRLTAVIVLDAFNKYPVGYAIGEQEDTELIRQANRNALVHIKELFGDFYRPAQLQSDNYGKGALLPFYQAMSSLYVPARVGNAKAKVIEPYFMYLNKTYCQPQPNWGGFNITSTKKNQVNRQMTDLIKGTFPDKAGVIKQIEVMMERERAKKVDAFVAAFAPTEDMAPMNDLNWLGVFGVPVGGTNKLTGQGIIKTIKGVEYTYDCFDPAFRENHLVDWQLRIDPNDMSKALVESADGRLRFVLQEKRAVPMDIRSMTDEDHSYHAQVMKYNRDNEEYVTEVLGRDAFVTGQLVAAADATNDDELQVKLRLTHAGQQKDRTNQAKNNGFALVERKEQRRVVQQEQIERQVLDIRREQREDDLVDFSKYLTPNT